MSMTIADGLKYIVALRERAEILKRKVREIDTTKESTKVLATNDDGTVVVSESKYTLSPKALMSEYDETAKEIRLVQQAIEKANHTTDLGIEAKF